MKLILGIDEAGRGPVLGSLFIGGVIFSDTSLELLESSDVNDSKKLSPKKREQLYAFIIENCLSYTVKEITNRSIDENKRKNRSLNDLELECMGEIIIKHHPNVVYIDALGQNLNNFKQKLTTFLSTKIDTVPEIITEHKADEKFKVVGAASILAKVKRDQSIAAYGIHYKNYGEIGSGYPSDDKTITFLRKFITQNKKPPKIARKSWLTCRNLMNELVTQKKIDDFFLL